MHFQSFEYVCVTITLSCKRTVTVLTIYPKQEVSFATFYEEMSTFIDKMIFKGDASLIMGDFNVWVDSEEDKTAKQLMTLMNANGLNQQVLQSKHRSGHTLDQIYINEFLLNLKHEVIHDTMGLTTDHYPILIEFPSAKVTERVHTKHSKTKKC